MSSVVDGARFSNISATTTGFGLKPTCPLNCTVLKTDCAAETLTSESPSALATIRTYDELHAALRRRADELKITRLSMDEVGGMPPGYFGKVLAPEQIKLAGKHSLGALLGVLGVMLIMVDDPEALARFTVRGEKRKMNANGRMLTRPTPNFAGLIANSRWGKEMRKVGILKISARKRKRIAETAAKARWAKYHAHHRDLKDRPAA